MDGYLQREKPKVRNKRFRWLIVLAVAIGFQCLAVWPTALQVRQAMLNRKVCYLPDYYQDDPERIPEFDYPVDIRYVSMEEFCNSVPAVFNRTDYLVSEKESIRVRVIPLIALYGSGTKSVWILETEEYYDHNNEYIMGAYRTPVRIDYRWKTLGWETENIEIYNFSVIDWYSETPLRDFWEEDLMLR